jgi:hypothetical protein
VAGVWRGLHDEDHYNLYLSANKIGIVKSGRIGWTGHVARIAANVIYWKFRKKESTKETKISMGHNMKMDVGERE